MTPNTAVNVRREAVVMLSLRGPGGAESDVNWVIDSGYTGSLTLPAAMIAALGLVRQSGGRAVLADGSSRSFDVHAAELAWDGAWRLVLVSAVGNEALLGMAILAGHELPVSVWPRGAVEIASLP